MHLQLMAFHGISWAPGDFLWELKHQYHGDVSANIFGW